MTVQTAALQQDLLGRVAIVTAAGSDPGRAVAVALAAAGARICCLDADGAAAKATANAVADVGGTAEAHPADAGDRAEIEAVIGEIARAEGRIDVLCTVACESGDGSLIEDLDAGEFDRLFRAGFKGTMLACQAAGRAMTEAGRGAIVNVSSAIIDVPAARTGAYAITAAAIAFLTKILAREVGGHGVRVNAIAAGPGQGFSPFGPGQDDLAAAAYAGLPEAGPVLGRDGTPGDVGGLAVFLASDASAYLTGQTIRLSGGWTMPW